MLRLPEDPRPPPQWDVQCSPDDHAEPGWRDVASDPVVQGKNENAGDNGHQGHRVLSDLVLAPRAAVCVPDDEDDRG